MSPLPRVYAWGEAGFAWGAPCREGPLRCSRGLLIQESRDRDRDLGHEWASPSRPLGGSRISILQAGVGAQEEAFLGSAPGCPGRAAPSEAGGRRPATLPAQRPVSEPRAARPGTRVEGRWGGRGGATLGPAPCVTASPRASPPPRSPGSGGRGARGGPRAGAGAGRGAFPGPRPTARRP